MSCTHITWWNACVRCCISFVCCCLWQVPLLWAAQDAISGKLIQVCVGETVRFELPFKAAPGALAAIRWNFDDPDTGPDNQSQSPHPTHVFQKPGRYDAALMYETSRGARDTLYFPILVMGPPDLALQVDGFCMGDSTTIFVRGTRAEIGRVRKWRWDVDEKIFDRPEGLFYEFGAPGNYKVRLRLQTIAGCTVDTSIAIGIKSRPEPPIVPLDTFCMGAPVVLQAIAPTGTTIKWYDQYTAKTPLVEGSLLRMEPAYFSSAVFVEQQGKTGCPSLRKRVPISVFSSGQLRIQTLPEVVEVKPKEPIALSFSTDAPLKDLQWTIDGKKYRGGMTLNQTFAKVGRYEVVATATHANGCQATISRWINVSNDARIALPRSFSPNGDGINDAFAIDDTLGSARIQIYNRWGQLVFASKNPGFSWDGRELNGKNAPDGVYVYKLEGAHTDGAPISHKGVLTLIR